LLLIFLELSPRGRPVRELLERALPANGTPFDFATYKSRLTAAPTGLTAARTRSDGYVLWRTDYRSWNAETAFSDLQASVGPTSGLP
jgi:hypothetical protein